MLKLPHQPILPHRRSQFVNRHRLTGRRSFFLPMTIDQ